MDGIAEAAAINHIRHRNVVKYFGILDPPGGPTAILLEYAAGGNLVDLLQRGPLPPLAAKHVLSMVAQGLQGIHGANVVHRDLKPENVLLRRPGLGGDDAVVVADFGIARFSVSGRIADTRGLGTPGYAAPEQALTGGVTESADLYGLGGIGLFLLTGKHPDTTMRGDEESKLLLHRARQASTAEERTLWATVAGLRAARPDERTPLEAVISVLSINEYLLHAPGEPSEVLLIRATPHVPSTVTSSQHDPPSRPSREATGSRSPLPSSLVARRQGLTRRERILRRHPLGATTIAAALRLLGAIVGGRYQILDLHAVGRESNVFVAIDLADSRTLVAIKTPVERLNHSAQERYSLEHDVLRSEAAHYMPQPLLQDIAQPRGEDANEDVPALVMSYIPHRNLYEHISGNSLKTDHTREATVSRIAIQFVHFWQRLLARGWFYGDVCTENIMCSSDGEVVWVVDAGSAVHADPFVKIGWHTPAYLTPNLHTLIRRRRAVHGTIQSVLPMLGKVLHFALTNRPPIPGRMPDPSLLSDASEAARIAIQALLELDLQTARHAPQREKEALRALDRWHHWSIVVEREGHERSTAELEFRRPSSLPTWISRLFAVATGDTGFQEISDDDLMEMAFNDRESSDEVGYEGPVVGVAAEHIEVFFRGVGPPPTALTGEASQLLQSLLQDGSVAVETALRVGEPPVMALADEINRFLASACQRNFEAIRLEDGLLVFDLPPDFDVDTL